MVCSTGWHRRRPCVLCAHQDRRPQYRHTSIRRERQKQFEPRTTNVRSRHYTQANLRPWQWPHVSGQFWGEWQWLILCWGLQKLAHNLGQHAGTWGPHPITPTDAWGCQSSAWGYHPTNRALRPAWRYWPYIALWWWNHPGQKAPRKWRFPPRYTPLSFLHSPLTYIFVDLVKPPLRPHVKSGNSDHLLITADHPKVCLKASNNALFCVYQ